MNSCLPDINAFDKKSLYYYQFEVFASVCYVPLSQSKLNLSNTCFQPRFCSSIVFTLTDACDLTFDPGTAHKNICLSEGNQNVSWVKEMQNYRNNKERFENFPQVLASQGLERRCYWEMEVMEPFTIGVAYKTIERKGVEDDCKLGRNDKSWCLTCGDDGYYVWHNNESVSVSSHCSRSSRVGVYLDTVAGTLSFYRVSLNSQFCLHTFESRFSDLLYPAVTLDNVSSAMFCQPV